MLACLLTLIGVGVTAPAKAMTADQYFEEGNRLVRDGLYWAALLRYRQALESGMDTPLLHYNTGVANYRADQYDRAEESLLLALDSPTLRVAAQYNLGLNAYAAGDERDALRWFRLVRDNQQNEQLAQFARVAIHRIRQVEAEEVAVIVEEERRRQRALEFTDLDLRARVSFGTDSNVFRSPSEAYVDFSDPAQPLVTPTVQSGAFMPVSLGAKYRINAFDYEGFFGAYRLSGRYYQDEELENANEFIHELSFGSDFHRVNEEKGRDTKLYSAFTIAQHDEVYYDPDDGDVRSIGGVDIEDRMNYLRYGPELRFRRAGERLAVGLEVTGQLWNYEDTEVVPEYDHEYFLFDIYTQYRFTSTSLLRLSAAKSSRRFGDRPSFDLNGQQLIDNDDVRYDYLDLGVLARQRVTDNLWFGVEYERRERTDRFQGYNDYIRNSYGFDLSWEIGRRFDFRARAFYRLYDYPNAFAFHDPALPQKTLEVADARVTASYRMTRNLYLDLRADYRDQVSNDGRIAYNRNQLILGVRWEQ